MKLTAEVRDVMRYVRDIAAHSPSAICWVCGGKPHDGLWEADHTYPLLGQHGPLAAACRYCNRSRQQKIPSSDAVERLFWSPQVVRSCGADEMRHIARHESKRLFGSTAFIETLIATVDGDKRVLNRDRKSDKASNEALKQLKSVDNGTQI